MQCCYVKWSGGPSNGKTRIVLIGSVGPMPKSTFQISPHGERLRITQAVNHGSAKIFRMVFVLTHVTMSPMVDYKDTFVLFV